MYGFTIFYIFIIYTSFFNTFLFSKRFIDDLLVIDIHKLSSDSLDSIYPNLKLNIAQDKCVTFLDLNISFNYINKLSFDL